MLSWILLFFATIQAILFIESFRWSDNSRWRIWFVRLLLFVMAYDNFIQGSGVWLYEKAWYEWANYIRYCFRVGSLPFFVLFTFSILREISTSVGRNSFVIVISVLFTIFPLGYGIFKELIGIQLAATDTYGVVRLTSLGDHTTYAHLAIIFYTIILSLLVWKLSGWKWLLLGILYSFLMSIIVNGQLWGFVANGLGGLVLMVAMLKTERHFTLPGR